MCSGSIPQTRAGPCLQMALEESTAEIKELKLRLSEAEDSLTVLATINKSLKDELRHTLAGVSAHPPDDRQ